MVPVEERGNTVWVTLNRPDKANAFSAAFVEELIEAVDRALTTSARVLVIRGEGRTLCGGFDLSGLDDESDASLAYRFLRIEVLLQKVYYAPIYTIALAHGAVAGAGADLVAACRKRVAAPDARLRFPGTRFGVLLGSRRLLDLVGSSAYSLIVEQNQVSAREALGMGLASDIADQDDWDELVFDTLSRVEGVPAQTVAGVLGVAQSDAREDMGLIAQSVATPGLKERMRAYWEAARAEAARRKANRDA